MASKKILIEIKVADKGTKQIDDTKKSISKLAQEQKKLNFELTEEAKKLAVVKEQRRLATEANRLHAKSLLQSADANKQNRAQSGLNNAILIESGRVASDAAYGIQGMANNIGRLIELGQEFARTNKGKGLAGAFEELRRSFFGVGGVLIVIQLLLSFLPKLVKGFQNWIQEINIVNKALRDATKIYGGQIANLKTYVSFIQDANVSEEQRSIAVKKINKEFKGLNISLDESNKLTDKQIEKINTHIKTLERQGQSQALLSLIQDKYKEKYDLVTQSVEENIFTVEGLLGAIKGFGSAAGVAGGAIQGATDVMKTGEINKQIDKLLEKLKEIGLFDDEDSPAGRASKTRAFRQVFIDLTKIIQQYNKEAEKLTQNNLQERLDLDEDFAKRDADRRLNVFIERQKQRLEEYKEQVKGKKNAAKLIADAEREVDESIEDAKKEHYELLLSIEDAFITKRILLADKEAKAIANINRKQENLEINNLKFSLDANQEYYTRIIKQKKDDIIVTKDLIENGKEYGLSEREIAQERFNLATLESQVIDLTTKKEIEAIKEKTRVNLEYVSFAQGISSLLGTIAGENEAIQKAALVLEKGSAIANVVIKTQQSNQGARAMALLNPIGVREAYQIKTEAQIARNNIGAGIAIANILATTISSFKKPSVGGGGGAAGGGLTVEAPDFNVVGASEANQLATAIGGQVPTVNKAFVSVKDFSITEGEYNRDFKQSKF
jgi:hypothetical protein